MAKLAVLDARGTPDFPDRLRAIWEAGDAALPVDPRLPAPARAALLEAMGAGEPVDDGDALVVATGGTTGAPKGVVLTHDAVAASAVLTSRALGVDPGADRWLACLPLAHIGGLSVVTRALLTGTPLTVHDGFDPAAVEDAAAAGCTLVSLVPTALRRVDAGRYRVVLLGGSPSWEEPPANAVATYGMTESGSGVVYGGRPLPGVEVRVDEAGQLWLRSPTLLRCYRDGTDPRDAQGWYPTGDAGSVEPDGTVAVTGRLDDAIVTGGEKVWPEPVERVLRAVPGVADVAITGVADPEWGARVVALVVPAGDAPSLAQLRDAVKAVLPAYCAPRAVAFTGALPRTPLGKLDRASLLPIWEAAVS